MTCSLSLKVFNLVFNPGVFKFQSNSYLCGLVFFFLSYQRRLKIATPVLQFCEMSWIIPLKVIFSPIPIFSISKLIICCFLSAPHFLPHFFLLLCFAFVYFEISWTTFSNSSVEFFSAIIFRVSKSSSLFSECSHPPLKIVICILSHECCVISLKFSSVPCLVSVAS